MDRVVAGGNLRKNKTLRVFTGVEGLVADRPQPPHHSSRRWCMTEVALAASVTRGCSTYSQPYVFPAPTHVFGTAQTMQLLCALVLAGAACVAAGAGFPSFRYNIVVVCMFAQFVTTICVWW